ncbi:MAG: hypothetical protein QOG10_4119 [Kribbellaceae bacterium]|nr:hypothetical protein [Kribbellaceae bacterium]
MKSKPTENEQYLTASNRITGVVVMVIGLLGLLDILLEWRTISGLLVGALIGILILSAYVGLVRPSVTLSPDELLIRNHIRDHHVPWNQITEADVTDILRVQTANQRLRCPGVQLVMRDMRKQRVGGRKLGAENSISRAEFVVDRIENHIERHGPAAKGEVVTAWARPELWIFGGLVVVALLAWLSR